MYDSIFLNTTFCLLFCKLPLFKLLVFILFSFIQDILISDLYNPIKSTMDATVYNATEVPEVQSATSIALYVLLPICIIIIGSLVGVIVYLLKKPR